MLHPPPAGASDPTDAGTALSVVVAVCTFRRPAQLLELLRSLEDQALPPEVRMHVLVIDNSPDFEARAPVAEFAGTTRLTVTYVAHGGGNISDGRNEALRQVPQGTDFLAFVDDDEVAEPEWLAVLVDAQRRTGADVVTGPVLAEYPSEAPPWLRADALYSVARPGPGAFVEEAVTGNALLRLATVQELGLTFDLSLGRSGGEDQLFFRTARARGASLWFEPDAVVRESVPAERLNARYLLRREYRKGNTLGLLDRSRSGWPAGAPARRLLKAVFWLLTGVAASARSSVSRDRQGVVVGLMRVSRAAGMVTGLRGSTFAHYADAGAPAPTPAVVLVVQEDPAYQRAGHSQYLSGFVSHCTSLGLRVVLVVTEGRLGFGSRRRGTTVYRAAGLVDIGSRQVVVSPRLLLRRLAWSSFRAAPRSLQNVADIVRTAGRSGRKVDHSLGSELSPEQQERVARVLAREQPHVVLFSGPFSVPRPLRLPASVKASVLVCHDVVSARAAGFRASGLRVVPPAYSEDDERAAMVGMTAVTAIQWDDAEVFRRLAPEDAEVLVCPVTVSARIGERAPVEDRCLFVGSGTLPNVEGLSWFLEHCWPAVRAARPQAQLQVVGTVCARIRNAPPGVVLRGEVVDLSEEYAGASVVVVPLRTGSGLKVKIVEAIGHGAAVVTTSVGAQGLSRLTPRPFCSRDDAQELAAAVVDVLSRTDERRRLEEAARQAALLFTPDKVFEELDDHLRRRGVPLTDARVPDGALAARAGERSA